MATRRAGGAIAPRGRVAGSRGPIGVAFLLLSLSLCPASAGATDRELAIDVTNTSTTRELLIAAALGDVDEDGTPDGAQTRNVPSLDLRPFRIVGTRGPVRIATEGSVRILRHGKPLTTPATLRGNELATTLHLQGTAASEASGDSAIVVEAGEQTVRQPITVVAVRMLDSRHQALEPSRDAIGISRRVTNDASLPRMLAYEDTSPDPENVRVEIADLSNRAIEGIVTVESVDPSSGEVRSTLRNVPIARPNRESPFRSPWLRLVGDRTDAQAPGVTDRVLLVALRDLVRVRYRTPDGEFVHVLRVGRPSSEDHPRAARRASLRIRVLRTQPGGSAVIGTSDASALAIAREQVAIANEVWLQCFIGFGPPEHADVAIVDPPPPSLLAIADGDGLPAQGGGEIRFRADGRSIGPVVTRAGDPPVATALAVARALEAKGFRARVTENAAADFGAGRAADIVVRRRDGQLVRLSKDGDLPLGTDTMQSVQIGSVDLSDGMLEFDNMNASSGTIEERTLIKTLADDDPSTIELFIVNHFSRGTRQGEAFIDGDGGAIVNAVILDRAGLRQQRAAWTQAHELGHVLLNHPLHPDNVGPDRPWLLMDSDTSLPLVTGPKRIDASECARARASSGIHAYPPLLRAAEPH